MNAECKTCDKRGGYYCTEECEYWEDESRSSDTLDSLVVPSASPEDIKQCSLCAHQECELDEWPCVGCSRARQVQDHWKPKDRETQNLLRRIQRRHNRLASR